MITKRIFITIVSKDRISEVRKVKDFASLIDISHFSVLDDTFVGNIFRVEQSLNYSLETEWDIEISKEFGKPLFYKEELNEYYKDNDLLELSHYSLKRLIDKFRKELESEYKDLEKKFIKLIENKKEITKFDISDLHSHFISYGNEWSNRNNYLPYNLDKDLPFTNSYKKDYLIYEIVELYRRVNWDTHSIISYIH